MTVEMVASTLDPAVAVLNGAVPAGEPWMGTVRKGEVFRILDLEGNQAVDALFYNAADSEERYSASNTMRAQANLYLTSGTRLMSNRGNVMLDIVADTCGRHDTLGGACSAESNTVRYAIEKRHMHSCRDNFLAALARADFGITKRDLPSNINFFMNFPVTPGRPRPLSGGILSARRWR